MALKVGAIGSLPRTTNVVTKAALSIVALVVDTGGRARVGVVSDQLRGGFFVGVVGQVVAVVAVFLTGGCCSVVVGVVIIVVSYGRFHANALDRGGMVFPRTTIVWRLVFVNMSETLFGTYILAFLG